jgi:hypothetical protein
MIFQAYFSQFYLKGFTTVEREEHCVIKIIFFFMQV